MTFTNETYQARVDATLSLIDDLMQAATDADRNYLASSLDQAYKVIDLARRELPVPPPFKIGDRVKVKPGNTHYAVTAVAADGAVNLRALRFKTGKPAFFSADELQDLKLIPARHQLNLKTSRTRS